MKRKMLGLILLGVLVAIVAVCFIMKERGKEPEPEYVFTYAENQSEGYPTTLGAYRFAELVEEKTNGRIKIVVKAGGELGDEQSVIAQMQFGGIDFTRASLSSVADEIPKLNVLQMPFLYRDSAHMWKILDGEVGEEFFQAFEDSDLVALSWYDAGARNFYNSVRPIRVVSDMKGLNIRVQEYSLMVDVVEALGANAAPMVYSDVYSALEKGVIDGAENNWPSYESMGHYEIAKFFTVDEHTRVPEVQLCAQTTWEKLSREDQLILQECARESAAYERQLWTEREKKSREIAISKGVQVTELTREQRMEFQEAVSGVYEIYCKDYLDIIEKIKETE